MAPKTPQKKRTAGVATVTPKKAVTIRSQMRAQTTVAKRGRVTVVTPLKEHPEPKAKEKKAPSSAKAKATAAPKSTEAAKGKSRATTKAEAEAEATAEAVAEAPAEAPTNGKAKAKAKAKAKGMAKTAAKVTAEAPVSAVAEAEVEAPAKAKGKARGKAKVKGRATAKASPSPLRPIIAGPVSPVPSPEMTGPEEPKKPMTAYFLYVQENREQVQEELGLKDFGPVTKKLSEKWKSLSASEKEPFEKRAMDLKTQYSKDIEAFKEAGGIVGRMRKARRAAKAAKRAAKTFTQETKASPSKKKGMKRKAPSPSKKKMTPEEQAKKVDELTGSLSRMATTGKMASVVERIRKKAREAGDA